MRITWMPHTVEAARSRLGARVAVLAALLIGAGGCTYDFDAAFAPPDSVDGSVAGDAQAADAGEDHPADQAGPDATSPTDGQAGACESTGGTCAATPPSGWSGPFYLEEAAAVVPPTCSGGDSGVVFTGWRGFHDPGPAQCSACTCSPPPNPTCIGAFRLFASADCSGTPCSAVATPPDTCVAAQCAAGAQSFRFGAPEVTAACSAAVQSPTVPLPAWDASAVGCSATVLAATCGSGSQCVAGAAGTSSRGPCIATSGLPACPGGYPVPTTYYLQVDDTRTCTPCTCGAADVSSCGGNYQISSGSTCGGPSFGYAQGDCNVFAATDVGIKTQLTASQLTCPPTGGVPEGQIQPAGELTVCCVN